MENASKALLIAGGILIAIIIIGVMMSLFYNAGQATRQTNNRADAEAISTFNSNFTQYLNRDLTIHEVVTICNFARHNGIHTVTVTSGAKTEANIKSDVNAITGSGQNKRKQKVYRLNIPSNGYTNGYVSKISFSENGTKVISK